MNHVNHWAHAQDQLIKKVPVMTFPLSWSLHFGNQRSIASRRWHLLTHSIWGLPLWNAR